MGWFTKTQTNDTVNLEDRIRVPPPETAEARGIRIATERRDSIGADLGDRASTYALVENKFHGSVIPKGQAIPAEETLRREINKNGSGGENIG